MEEREQRCEALEHAQREGEDEGMEGGQDCVLISRPLHVPCFPFRSSRFPRAARSGLQDRRMLTREARRPQTATPQPCSVPVYNATGGQIAQTPHARTRAQRPSSSAPRAQRVCGATSCFCVCGGRAVHMKYLSPKPTRSKPTCNTPCNTPHVPQQASAAAHAPEVPTTAAARSGSRGGALPSSATPPRALADSSGGSGR